MNAIPCLLVERHAGDVKIPPMNGECNRSFRSFHFTKSSFREVVGEIQSIRKHEVHTVVVP